MEHEFGKQHVLQVKLGTGQFKFQVKQVLAADVCAEGLVYLRLLLAIVHHELVLLRLLRVRTAYHHVDVVAEAH